MGNVNIVSTFKNYDLQKKTFFKSSSSVFFGVYNPKQNLDTEVSLLNHFILKRGVKDVIAKFELRCSTGKLKKTFFIKLDKKCVYSFRISNYLKSKFIGSIYVFFKSKENLFIPFCAVVGSVIAKNSVCAVHTYARRLEQKEIGTNIDIKNTIESCWTIRDTYNIKSFAILHGGKFDLSLSIRLECTNSEGKTISKSKKISLPKFGTFILVPQDFFQNIIIKHLRKKKGQAKVLVKGLRGVFPRMCIGNFSFDNSQFSNLLNANEIQYTHSNFDYSDTSIIKQPDSAVKFGYCNQPSIPNGYAMAYAVETKKKIFINNKKYKSNTLHKINIKPMSQIKIISKKDNLPARFNLALVTKWKNATLESEMSNGLCMGDAAKVKHHWKWGLLKPSSEEGDNEISIMFNDFNQSTKLPRKLKLRIYDEKSLIKENNIFYNGNKVIKVKDILSSKKISGTLWYVLTGDNLEDLQVFSTFYPISKAGFVEHAF